MTMKNKISMQMADKIAVYMQDKKAKNIVILDVKKNVNKLMSSYPIFA